MTAPKWSKKFQLPDESYSVSVAQDCFGYIIKKHETVTDNPPIRIYVNKIENRITFKIKTGHYIEVLMAKMMEILGSTINKITKG